MRKGSMTAAISAMTVAAAMTISAQTPSTQTPAGQTPRTSGGQRTGAASQQSEQTVTVTGCIQQDTAAGMGRTGSAGTTGSADAAGAASGSGSSASGAAGTSGSSGMSGASNSRSMSFVLANAKMAQGSSTSGMGTATRLSLTGSEADLQKHLNHQVEVTGRLSAAGDSSGSMGSGMSGTAHTTGSAGTTGSGTTGSAGTTGTAGSTGTMAGGDAHARSGAGMNMSNLPQLTATSIKMIAATCAAQ